MLALEFRDESFHRGDYCHVIGRKRQIDHTCDAFADFSVIVFAHLGDLDFTVKRGEGDFLIVKDFLIEFLSVTQT